jgi:hypothetical protein
LTNATEGDNTITVSYTPGALNGASSGEVRYQYLITGGDWSNLPGNNVISAGNNGTYSVQLRAVTTADGSTYSSDPSNRIDGLRPYGAPGRPSVDGSKNGDQSVNFSWSPPGPNGRSIVGTEYRINNGTWTAAGPSGSASAGNDYEQSFTIEVVAIDELGQRSAAGTAHASTSARPQPKAFISRGSPCGADDDGSGNVKNCYNLYITLEDWPAGGQVTCRWTGSSWPESLPRNSGKNTQWWSEDTPGTAYTLESQAARITCDGVQAQARR